MPSSFTFTLTPASSSSSSSSSSTGAQLAGETAFRDFKLDALTGDLELVEGDLPAVVGLEGVASDLGARLQTFAAEWVLDTSIGLPYFTEIADRPDDRRLAEIFRTEILGTPGVVDVDALKISIVGRELAVTFRAVTDLGVVIDAALQATA